MKTTKQVTTKKVIELKSKDFKAKSGKQVIYDFPATIRNVKIGESRIKKIVSDCVLNAEIQEVKKLPISEDLLQDVYDEAITDWLKKHNPNFKTWKTTKELNEIRKKSY